MPNLNSDVLDGLHAKDRSWVTGAHTAAIVPLNSEGTWTTIPNTSFTTTVASSWTMRGQANVGFTTGGLATTSVVNLRFLVNGKTGDDPIFPPGSGIPPSA